MSTAESRLASGGRFNPLPRGARDLLPPAFRRRRRLTTALMRRMERWGYEPVATPSLEYFEVLARGLDDDERQRCVRFTETHSGEVVALRSDVTPQIARLVSQRLADAPGEEVVRLCYAAATVAMPKGDDDVAERHQVGVELIGDATGFADAELLALCDAILTDVGSANHRFDLAHTGVLRRVLGSVPTAVRPRARILLARKDRDGLGRLDGAKCLVGLCGLVGEARPTLERARRELAPFGVEAELDRLDAVVHTLGDETRSRVDVDLGEVRGHDYYTGLRIRVWAPGSGTPIVRGGRYDDLLGRFGQSRPATGFAVDLDALEQALPLSVEDQPAAGTLVAVIGTSAETRRTGERAVAALRAEGRAWIEVVHDRGEGEARAMRRAAKDLVVIDDESRREWTRRGEAWVERGGETKV